MSLESIARRIRVGTKCQKEIEIFLRGLTPDKLFEPKTWKKLPAFVKVVPNGDILPSRSKYSLVSNDWQVAVNYLHAADHAGSEGLWYSLPDVAASVLLTGKVPKIIDAFKLVPEGKHCKRHSEAVLTLAGIDQAAWSECAAASAATFQGRSSSMRLIGCSTMRDRTFRR